MNTTLVLVRHGETEWNALGKFQGCKDINLSNEGILQAQFVKKRFENDFDCIYTSPLKRALQTAEIISNNTNLNPIIEPQLREINFGDWEGLTIREIANNYPNNFNKWRTDELDAPLCGGDISLKKASIRAKSAILEIVKKHKGKNIVIVSHGGIIKAGLIGLFNWKMTMYHKIVLGNTAVCKITFDDNFNPTIITLNDTSHLPNDYSIKSYV
ncbi:phosphoglycerate mutase [Clostridium polyendosporum]|uniref:Phosphoglycerate mutase n=1 Tax=Clostridium polyendosporum TaxID=69208 RepID=A0A919S0U8_9CLOT|nr:histidine phosphatase family protein [Clostridium polyendosporum]GIM29095.1 phosphoglycerate mutase [Clostridium polyendosporum]